VVKIISDRAASRPHTDGSIVLFTRWRQCAPPSNTWFTGSTGIHTSNSISIGSALFAQVTAESPYTLKLAAPFPLKIAPMHGGSGPISNTWFLGPTWVYNPNGMSISSAVFARLTTVTDRPTDRQTDRPYYSICNNRPHIRSTVMWANNTQTHTCASWTDIFLVNLGYPIELRTFFLHLLQSPNLCILSIQTKFCILLNIIP